MEKDGKSRVMVPRIFHLLSLFLVLNITFQLISDATAGKIISIFGFGVSVTVIYFPFVYIISDVVTEVYGYARARTILCYTMAASIIAGVMYQVAVAVPAASFVNTGEAYSTVFGIVPRVLIGGWLAVFAGDISNNYTLAKIKVLMKGRMLWVRTITSTIVGQFANTLVFYIVALSGVIPRNVLIQGIIAGWILKTAVEVIMTPVTYLVVNWVKRVENVDHYDRDTNFNPFIIRAK